MQRNGPDKKQSANELPAASSGVKRKTILADLNISPNKRIRLDRKRDPGKSVRMKPTFQAHPTQSPGPRAHHSAAVPPPNQHGPGIESSTAIELPISPPPRPPSPQELPDDEDTSDMESLFGDNETLEDADKPRPEASQKAATPVETTSSHGIVDNFKVLRWMEMLKRIDMLCPEAAGTNTKLPEQLYALLQSINNEKANAYLTPQVLANSGLGRLLLRFRHKPWERRSRKLADTITKFWRQRCREVEEQNKGWNDGLPTNAVCS